MCAIPRAALSRRGLSDGYSPALKTSWSALIACCRTLASKVGDSFRATPGHTELGRRLPGHRGAPLSPQKEVNPSTLS